MTMDYFLIFLMLSGVAIWTAILICVGIFAVNIFTEACQRTSREWKIKHRFKKKPVAKCYCIDCFYYKDNCKINKTGRCLRLERIVADDGFCKDAFPYREDDCK